MNDTTLSRVDLHVHSCYSRHPSEWFLQRLGAQESYTEVEEVYRRAKSRGARFVTLTDHNTIDGALELVARHPADCFVSTEVTTYFPEDGCKAHLLCYGIAPAQFVAIQKARENVYNLRDYLRTEKIACSVAHATFNINGRLTADHIEKLVVLFDVFEGINGARDRVDNTAWQRALSGLTPELLARLAAKHRLDPWGNESWIKGITGGSDDHAGLFIGETHTAARAQTVPEFLDALRAKRTLPGGRSGDHKSLAYAIYKIASAYAQRNGGAKGLPGLLASILFAENGPPLRDWFLVKKLGLRRTKRDRLLARFLDSLMEITREADRRETDWLVERVYAALATLLDDCISETARSIERGVRGEEATDLFQYVGVTLPAGFFSVPFFSTLRLLHRDRNLHQAIETTFGLTSGRRDTRVLWFSDAIFDLSGVSVTMQEVAACAHRLGRSLRLVGCLTPEEMKRRPVPPGLINLPCIYAVTPGFYDAHTLRVPSLLRAIDCIAAHHPDRIVISTPGPVGLIGLIAAHLLNVPSVGIYHTDFTSQAKSITGDFRISSMVEAYTRWFFMQVDEVRVPSNAYIDQLADRGLDRRRMKPFRRGLDGDFTAVDAATREAVRLRWFADGRPTLLYAGRIGQEKNLGFLIEVFAELRKTHPNARLLLAGEGPALSALIAAATAINVDVIFAGRIERAELRAFYALADVFVFPSITDTFGMAVLEAQAFGLPAVVADVGGPPEIIVRGRTGYALPADDRAIWVQTLGRLLDAWRTNPTDYARWRDEIRTAAHSAHNWETLIDDLMGPRPAHPVAPADVAPEDNPGVLALPT